MYILIGQVTQLFLFIKCLEKNYLLETRKQRVRWMFKQKPPTHHMWWGWTHHLIIYCWSQNTWKTLIWTLLLSGSRHVGWTFGKTCWIQIITIHIYFLVLHFQGSNTFESIFICLRKIYKYLMVFLNREIPILFTLSLNGEKSWQNISLEKKPNAAVICRDLQGCFLCNLARIGFFQNLKSACCCILGPLFTQLSLS